MISVIYVDDEPGLLELGKLFLEKDGRFSVETVISARQALDVIRSRNFDAIISDYQMPGMDGIEFLKQVRASGNTIPFIIFTGRGREEIVIQALNEGADFYLQKGGEPVSQFTELVHKVEKAVLQRRAEASIRDHERREADIINFLPDATFAIDTNGVVIAWNRAMEKMTGVRSGEVVGKGNYEYSIPFYHERRPILIDLVLHDRPEMSGRYPFIKREGRTLFSEITIPHFNDGRGAALWFTASPLYDMQGTIVGAIESIREITERKRAERALHESERRFRELSDLLPQVVFEADVDGMLTYANHIAFDLFGYSEDEVRQGFCILQTLAPFERERAGANIRKLLEGGPKQSEADDYLAIKKDGTTFPVTVYSSPVIVNGKATGLRGVVVDNTERRRTDEALQQSEVRFRSLIQNASDMIRILDRDGKVVYESPSTVAIMGYPAGENLGKDPFAFVHPDDIERVKADLREVYDRTNPGTPTEFRARKADGTYIWVDTIATNMLDVPAVNGIVVTTRPIEQRKMMEQAIRESEEMYRTIFETTGTATVLIENDATIYLANSEFVRLSGFLKEEIEGKKKWTEFVTKDDLDRMLAQHRLRRTAPGHALKHYEFRFLSRSGGIRDIYLTIDVIPGTERSVASLLDITERKRVEEDLIAANREYTGLLNQIQDIYYRSDTEGRVVRASQSWATLLGYDDISECLGRSIAGEFYLNPGDREKFLEAVYRDGKVTDYEVVLKKKDGTPVLVSTSSHLYYDPAGHVLGVEGTFRDITVRKLHERILKIQLALGLALQNVRDLKETLDLCLDAAIDIAGMDAGGIYLVDEQRGSVDLVVSRNLGEEFVASVSHYPAGSDNARIVLAGKPLYVQFSRTGVQHTDVQEKEGLKAAAIVPISYGGRILSCLNIASHTLEEVSETSRIALGTIATQIGAAIERIRSEEALAESEQRYRNIVEDQTEFISRFLPDGTHVFVNEAYCRYFGLEREEILGRKFQPEIPPEDRARVAQFFASLTPEHPVDVIEHRIVMPDGSVRWQRWSDRAIFDESGVLKEYQSVGRDITTRRETEYALVESEQRNAAILAALPDLLFIISRDGTFLDVQTTDQNLLALPTAQIVGKNVLSTGFEPATAQAILGAIGASIDTGALRQVEYTLSVPRGDLHFEARLVRLDANRVLGVVRNITRQKVTEEALRASEEKYRLIADNTADHIWIFDMDLNLKYSSPSVIKMKGFTIEESLSQSLSDMMTPESVQRVLQRFHDEMDRDGLEGVDPDRRITFETEEYCKDGTTILVENAVTLLRDTGGTPVGILGVSRDITDRRRAELALEESSIRYLALFEQSPVPIWEEDFSGVLRYLNSLRTNGVTDLRDYLSGHEDALAECARRIRILSVNQASLVFFGVHKKDDLEYNLPSYFTADSYSVFMDELVALAEGRTEFSAEIPIRDLSGNSLIVSLFLHVVPGHEQSLDRVLVSFTDITRQKRASRELQESEARLRTIMQGVQTGIVIIDAETHRILDINEKALALIGGTEEEVVGAACHRFICPAEEGKCPITDLHQTIDASDRILVTCSGKHIPVLKTVIPAMIGGKAALIESFDDITEQKRVETALKESEEKYRSLSEASGDLIFVIDRADRVTYVNNSAARMLEIPVQDVIGKERSSLFPAEVAERQGHAIRKVFETGDRSRSTGQLQFDGKVLWFDHSLVPIRDAEGTVTHVLGISRDITEIKSVEETLRLKSDELDYRNQILRTLLDTVPIGIFMVEAPGGKPIIANREATRLLGRETLPDVTEETFSEMFEAYIAGTAERYPAEKIPLIRGIHGESSYVDDAMIVRPDGTHIQLEIFGTPIRDRSGRVIASLVSFLDITERKQAEETIKSLAQFPEENPWPVLRIGGNGLLLYVNNPGREWLSAMQVQPGESQAPDILSLVADTIRFGGVVRRELQDAAGRYYIVTATQPEGEPYVNFYISDITERKQAERTILETNKKINLLTSITRHDVANQVTALKGFAQIALMKRPDPLVADLLGKIDNAGSMIARQIEFTRTYEELGLHAPGWHKVSEILARQKTDGITLSCTCEAEIYADPMVEKVFFNLIDNAIRHGERVTEIRVGCEQTPDGLTIVVADNGVGVPIKDKQKIFDKGYGKNTGFGLFLAREILAITRIAISEVGMYGRGARFELYVPEGAYRFR